MFGSKFFRVALFVRSIVSSIVMTVVFQYFVDGAMAGIAAKITGDPKTLGLLSNPDTRLGTILFYNLWVSFGVTTLMYVNAMYGIPPEQVEAARMDGAIGIREFWHVTLPSVFPTLATFLVTGVAGIFTNQLSIFNFYGSSAPPGIISYGYWLYKETLAGVYAPVGLKAIDLRNLGYGADHGSKDHLIEHQPRKFLCPHIPNKILCMRDIDSIFK